MLYSGHPRVHYNKTQLAEVICQCPLGQGGTEKVHTVADCPGTVEDHLSRQHALGCRLVVDGAVGYRLELNGLAAIDFTVRFSGALRASRRAPSFFICFFPGCI